MVFESGIVEALPFPDRQFDAVLSTVMLHHLGREARHSVQEVRRVLKPGGRVLAVDFARPAEGKKGLLGRFHHHGYLNFHDLGALLTQAGLNTVRSGELGIGDLHFVLASAPGEDTITSCVAYGGKP